MAETRTWQDDKHTAITPFWSRSPSFFLFPIHVGAMLRIMLLSALTGLGMYASGIGAMSIAVGILSLVCWIIFLRYGCLVLSETSLGHLRPSDYPDEKDETLAYMPFKLFGLAFLWAIGLGFVVSLYGEGIAWAANAVLMLFLPAGIIVLVVSRSLFAGLNPARAWSTIRAIGKPYLLLCVFLMSLSAAQAFLTAQLFVFAAKPLVAQWQELSQMGAAGAHREDVREALTALMNNIESMKPRLFSAMFCITAVGMYFTLIVFNMLGYVTYQYHRELGLDADMPEARGSAARAAADPVGRDIAQLVAAGNLDQAIDLAFEAQRLDAEDITAHERYSKLLHLAGKNDRLFAHARRFIAVLLRKGMVSNALEVIRRCRERDPAFRMEEAKQVLALAEAAHSGRDPKLALDIMTGFDKAFPRHPLIPDVYFLSARILCEDMRQDAVADKIFAALRQNYSEHPKAEEAARYQQMLAKLQAG